MDYKEKAINRFKNDLYATKITGIEIQDVNIDYAKCSLLINENHLNAAGFVMGGAIFTLADFTFAVAANCEKPLTVSLSCQINYINATKGPVLFAQAECIKNSKSICFYQVSVDDENGNNVANVSITGFRKQ